MPFTFGLVPDDASSRRFNVRVQGYEGRVCGMPLIEQSAPLLGNVNTPEDLAAAHRRLGSEHHS